MKVVIISGVLSGFVVAFVMTVVPVFHGFDSNEVRNVIFNDENKQYVLIPSRIKCN